MKEIKLNAPRRVALEKYYEDPAICLFCGKVIQVKTHERPCDVKRRKFCDRICSAQYNKRSIKNKVLNKQRRNALILYYNNPNKCLECGKIIEIKLHEDINAVRIRKFCSNSCANRYNQFKKGDDLITCSRCGKLFKREIIYGKKQPRRSQSKYCNECAGSRIDSIKDKTKGELFQQRTSRRSAKNAILEDARNVYRDSGKTKDKCTLCGFEYGIEICHIKPVASFSDNTFVSEINNIDNLIALCPTHHTELDKGILDRSLLDG